MATKRIQEEEKPGSTKIEEPTKNPMGDEETEETLVEAINSLMEDAMTFCISSEEPMWHRSFNKDGPQLIGSPLDVYSDSGDTFTNLSSTMPITTNLADVARLDREATDRQDQADVGFLEMDDTLPSEDPLSFLAPNNNVSTANESVCSTGAIVAGPMYNLLDKQSKKPKKKLDFAIDSLLTEIDR